MGYACALAVWAIKTLLVQVPEPEIYYPAGVELTLALTGPMLAPEPQQAPATLDRQTTAANRGGAGGSRLRALMQRIPTARRILSMSCSSVPAMIWPPPLKPRDGSSRQQATLRAKIRSIRAVADGHGDSTAPMSDLLVEDQKADMSWQKSFNDVSKRHHIRIWKQPATWNGRAIWIGAATHDIDFAFWRPGKAMAHKIAENVDDERDKVVNDLLFTSCADVLDTPERCRYSRVYAERHRRPHADGYAPCHPEVNACSATATSLAFSNAALPLAWEQAAALRAPGNTQPAQRCGSREFLLAEL